MGDGRSQDRRAPGAWRAWWQAARAEGPLRPPAPARVGPLPLWMWLGVALLVGAAVRLYYFTIKGGMHYPDEIFQYLEPAYWHRTGMGHLAWEYRYGLRNWALPGYYGALLTLGDWVGLRGLALHRALALHNALLTLAVVPAGMRLGLAAARVSSRRAAADDAMQTAGGAAHAAGGAAHAAHGAAQATPAPFEGALGVLGAMAMAGFAAFGYFAPHTLSELHGLIFTTWALALWLELVAWPTRSPRRRGVALGVALGLAFVARYTLVVFALPPLIDLWRRGDRGALRGVIAGLGAALGALAALDLVTWGLPLHSFGWYISYNLFQDGASRHGVMPWDFYIQGALGARTLWVGGALLVGTALAVGRRHGRLLAYWTLPLVAFSLIRHKEERFILSIWPALLVAALVGWLRLGAALAGWLRPGAAPRWRRRAAAGLASAALVGVCALSWAGHRSLPMRWRAGLFRAQDWVGQQADATGLLVSGRLHLSGGHVLLDRAVPLQSFTRERLEQAVYNYVAVSNPQEAAALARDPRFTLVEVFETTLVYRRVDPGQAAGQAAPR